ncbi:MAG: GH3 auxin-responsive promoter family protein [Alistipes indistinctus]
MCCRPTRNQKWFAKSSGTTSAKSKFIPVSDEEGLSGCQSRGPMDAICFCRGSIPKAGCSGDAR